VPAGILSGTFASMDTGGNPWATMTGGGVFGLVLGLVFGGVRGN